jgi:acyl-CoA synthetase (NDP forming)
MSRYNLERIFNPDKVTVVGASERPGSIGNTKASEKQGAPGGGLR